MGYKVTAPTNLEGEHFNDRVDNFMFKTEQLLHVFEQQKINRFALVMSRIVCLIGFSFSGEYLITSQHRARRQLCNSGDARSETCRLPVWEDSESCMTNTWF